ncbi:hypothetical protein GCM10027348_35140 [Hymenobacter tenuis]
MQPTMPLLEEKGQLEIAANIQLTGRMEATAAYSPLEHVLVTGAGTVGFKWANEQDGYVRTRQGEVGLGGYWNLGEAWLLTATTGVGSATSHVKSCWWGCDDEFKGDYRKLYGQLGIAHFGLLNTLGVTYRLASVQFTNLLADGEPVPGLQTMRHELAVQQRRSLYGSSQWFVQSVGGVSLSNISDSNDGLQMKSDQYFTVGRPAVFCSLGLVWQPPLKRAAVRVRN